LNKAIREVTYTDDQFKELTLPPTIKMVSPDLPPAGRMRLSGFGSKIFGTTASSMLRFQGKGGKSREIPVLLALQRGILSHVSAAGIGAVPKTGRCSARWRE